VDPKIDEEKAGTLVPALRLSSPRIRESVESDYDIFSLIRWALGNLKFSLQFGGREGHALLTRVAPYFGQEVPVAQMMEHQLGAGFAGTLPLGLGVHGRHGLGVANLDQALASSFNSVGAGGQLRLSYLESERYIGLHHGLSGGAGSGEQERQRH
jgi:hypothetical protein